MLIYFILFAYGINANQVPMRQMGFRVLSNSYFVTTDSSSVILQKTISKGVSTSISCSRLCIGFGNLCSTAVYNNTNQICAIYNTTTGIQQTSSCCTTFINKQAAESVVTPLTPQISNPGSLFTGRRSHTATLLSSGRVLITGGRTYSAILSSCELYFPESQNWSVVASMNAPRSRHTATLLTINNTDLVLVIGGYYTTSYDSLLSVEYYNTTSGIWTMIANTMHNARFSHSTTVLINGHLLVAGGGNASARLTSTEIFDPNTFTWQTVGSLNTARFQHMDTILNNGNVFVAGGADSPYALQSCEIYDINLQTWSLVQSLTNPRNLGTLISLLSISNSILLTGGTRDSFTTYSSADLFYPSTNTMTPSSDMTYQRFAHTSNLISYQSIPYIVVAGGYNALYIGINSVQLFIITNSTWINLANLTNARGEHTATLLNTSPPSILIAGGRTAVSTTSVLNSVELLTF